MNILRKKIWSPYAVGAAIGLLTVASYYFFGQFVGVSSSFVTIVGWLGTLYNPEFITQSAYLSSMASGTKDVFQVALITGIVLGAFISALLARSFTKECVPTIWRNIFGASCTKRALGAFLGGILILFGARLAGGCTSGKAIASGLQLLVPAWIFIATLFITGIIVAHIVYKK